MSSKDDKIYPLSTLPAARDPFFQSIPLSDVQGRFFYFGRSGKHDFYEDEDLMIRDRQQTPRLDIPYDAVVDPRFGPPNALAYRIWVAIEKIISDSGGLFDGVLRLSGRDFSRLAGRSGHGKTTAKQVDNAISQLYRTAIYWWSEGSYVDPDTGEEREGLFPQDFTLFKRRMRIFDKADGKLKYIEIEVSDFVLKSILAPRTKADENFRSYTLTS